MRKSILLGALLFFLFQSCSSSLKSGNSNVMSINVDTFVVKMQEANTVVLDVRTPAEIALGKIENAIELDIRALGFEEKIKRLDKNKTYLVYCKSGVRSVKACKVLEKNGFKYKYNLLGGYKAWKSSQ